METIVERATSRDLRMIARLLDQGGAKWAGVVNEKFLDSDQNILLVARLARGTPCGFLYAYLLERLDSPEPMMFLYAIDVFPRYRRRGVGSKLVEALKTIAGQRGCGKMFVLTTAPNEAARALYEGTGGHTGIEDDVLYVYRLQSGGTTLTRKNGGAPGHEGSPDRTRDHHG